MRIMDPMKKDIKERAFFTKYIAIVNEIEDDQFVDKALSRENMPEGTRVRRKIILRRVSGGNMNKS